MKRALERGPRGAARQSLETHTLPGVDPVDGLKDSSQVVIENDLQELGPVLEGTLQLLVADTLPGFVDQPSDQSFRHDQRVVQHQPVTHRDIETPP